MGWSLFICVISGILGSALCVSLILLTSLAVPACLVSIDADRTEEERGIRYDARNKSDKGQRERSCLPLNGSVIQILNKYGEWAKVIVNLLYVTVRTGQGEDYCHQVLVRLGTVISMDNRPDRVAVKVRASFTCCDCSG